MNKTWNEILANPTLNRLAHKLNKRYLYMSEEDVAYIINETLNTTRIVTAKSKIKDK